VFCVHAVAPWDNLTCLRRGGIALTVAGCARIAPPPTRCSSSEPQIPITGS